MIDSLILNLKPKFIRHLYSITLGIVIILYLVSRLSTLMQMPIFLDEAIHISFARYAQAMNGSINSGSSLGKWLSIQTYAVALRLFKDNLLFARLVPVFLGLLNVLIIFSISKSVLRKHRLVAAFSGSIIYIVLPFAFFFDRIALTQQFLTTQLACSILITNAVIKKPTIIRQILLGFIITSMPFFHFTGVFLLPIPFIIILFTRPQKYLVSNLKAIAVPYLMSVTPILVYIIFVFPLGESGKLIDTNNFNIYFQLVLTNIYEVAILLNSVLTSTLIIYLIIGSILLIKYTQSRSSKYRIFFYWAVIFFIILPYILFFRTWYPRYFLPLLVPFCLIVAEVTVFLFAYIFSCYKKYWKILFCFSLFLIFTATTFHSFLIIFYPKSYPSSDRIRTIYTTGWTSGYGLNDICKVISQSALRSKGRIRLLRFDRWDLPKEGFDILYSGPDIDRINLQPLNTDVNLNHIKNILSDGIPTYFLFNSSYPYEGDRELVSAIRKVFNVNEVAHFRKPDEQDGLRIWLLKN